MKYTDYRKQYFTKTTKLEARITGIDMYLHDWAKAVAFYTHLLGKPRYQEGPDIHGWELGTTWLTIFPDYGNPDRTQSFTICMPTVKQAESLQKKCENLGAKIRPPSNQLMYKPIRHCPVTDPFGNEVLITAKLPITRA